MNVPSAIWVLWFAMKVRSSRGPYCDDVIDNPTTVIEKTTPETVTIAPAMALRAARADADVDVSHGTASTIF